MKPKNNSETCFACGGAMKPGKTTFTVDFGDGVVVVRDVPATVCSQCGMEWINDKTAEQVEKIVNEAKSKHSEVEVMSMPA